MTATHECPRDGCRKQIPQHMLACKPHWYQVPAALRSAVWNAWADGLGAGSPEHVQAIQDAIGAMNGLAA